MTSWIISSLHLITLGLGMGSVLFRAKALESVESRSELSKVFFADNLYGLAAFLWIGTGLWRAFGGLEKGTSYYLGSGLFWIKMGLFGLIFLLEIYPIILLMKWRQKLKRDQEIDLRPKSDLATISYIEFILILCIVFVATAMSRNLYY